MIFPTSPWAGYKPKNIPNLNPQSTNEARGCLGGIIAYCVASLIFAILMYFTHELKSNGIINMHIMMLLFIINVIIYVVLIFAFMNLSFKITDKINKKYDIQEKAKAYDEALEIAKKKNFMYRMQPLNEGLSKVSDILDAYIGDNGLIDPNDVILQNNCNVFYNRIIAEPLPFDRLEI